MKIMADDKIPFLQGVFEPFCAVSYVPGAKMTASAVRDADALIVRTRTHCDEALLAGSKVKFIATATIGHDHLDNEYLSRSGIEWVNAPGCNATSVMQYIAAALCAISQQRSLKLSTMTLGIVGVGNVGSKVLALANAMGIKTLLCDPPRARAEQDKRFVDLKSILTECDIITLHVPLTQDGSDITLQMANDSFFAALRRRPIFINSSRGEIVASLALKKAIREGKLAATVIDVWENEPTIDPQLLDLVDIGTPHIAGYSHDGKANATEVVVQKVAAKFDLPLTNWRPQHLTDPADPVITLPATAVDEQEILARAIAHTYDIFGDDARLRRSIATFEEQRGNYPLRREFTSYHIPPQNLTPKTRTALTGLGFNLK